MVCMLGLSVAGSFNFLRHYSKQPWRQLAEELSKNYQSGDLVRFLLFRRSTCLNEISSSNFLRCATDIPRFLFRTSSSDHVFTNKSGVKSGIAALQSLNTNNGRVWLVLQDGQMFNSRARAWLDVQYNKLKEWKLGGQLDEQIEMILYGSLG